MWGCTCVPAAALDGSIEAANIKIVKIEVLLALDASGIKLIAAAG